MSLSNTRRKNGFKVIDLDVVAILDDGPSNFIKSAKVGSCIEMGKDYSGSGPPATATIE